MDCRQCIYYCEKHADVCLGKIKRVIIRRCGIEPCGIDIEDRYFVKCKHFVKGINLEEMRLTNNG